MLLKAIIFFLLLDLSSCNFFDNVKDKVCDAADKVKDKTVDVAEKVKDGTVDLANKAKDEIRKATKKLVDASVDAYNKGKSTYKLAMNKFADWSDKELDHLLGNNDKKPPDNKPPDNNPPNNNPPKNKPPSKPVVEKPIIDPTPCPVCSNTSLPEKFSWREKKALTDVKDQQRCGCCYAFSAIATVESQNFIINNELISLSEQEILDCGPEYGCHQCNGGTTAGSYSYLIAHGVATEEDYKYDSEPGECRKFNSVLNVTGYYFLPDDEEKLQCYPVTYGPIAAGIQVVKEFFYYDDGVFQSQKCCSDSTQINHLITIVGYGEEKGTKYWECKNSWGESWAKKGYFKMLRGSKMCGISMDALIPIVKKKGS